MELLSNVWYVVLLVATAGLRLACNMRRLVLCGVSLVIRERFTYQRAIWLYFQKWSWFYLPARLRSTSCFSQIFHKMAQVLAWNAPLNTVLRLFWSLIPWPFTSLLISQARWIMQLDLSKLNNSIKSYQFLFVTVEHHTYHWRQVPVSE